jgi:2'-5' RNA ligase
VARVFVAVYPSPDVVLALAELPRTDQPGVRWVPPEQYHVTLRFLGDVPPDAVARAVDPVAARHPPPEVRLGPRVSRLGRSVICVPAAGLDELAGAIVAVTDHLGDPPDPRPFRGHLTLARLRGRAACGLAGTPFTADFTAREVHLVQSITRPEGAEHELIRRWHLGD